MIREEGKGIGLEEGREIGLEEGKGIGLEEGKEIGIKIGIERATANLIKNMLERDFSTKDIQGIIPNTSEADIQAIKQTSKTNISDPVHKFQGLW